jgi:hypothetical protein
VTFNEPMQAGTFTPAKIASFTDPMGNPVTVTGVTVVPFTDNMTFDIQFNPAGRVGTYTMVIGPNILDLYGNQMDQNQNFITGELGVAPAGDQFRLTFNITGPMVVSASPSEGVHPPVDHVRLTYNEPMNPATFTADLVTFTGPDGSPIDVTEVQPVAGSNNTQFDVSFDAQTTLGAYTLMIADGVMDFFGNSAPAFTDHFTLNLVVNGGFETGDFAGWTTLGSTSIKTASFGTGPTQGTFDALITNDSGPDHAAVESFLSLDPNALATLVSNVTNGSAIKQTVNVTAGMTLTFDWNFLTSEAAGEQTYRDFGFVSITPVATGGTLIKLADTTSTLITAPGATGFPRMTGFHSFSITFTTDGTYSIGVGAMNAGDQTTNSALLVDNFQITPSAPPSPGPVPQPRRAHAASAAASGVSISAAGSPGAAPIDTAFAAMVPPSFVAVGMAGVKSAHPPFAHNDLLTSANQSNRWRAASSTPLGQVQIHGSGEFDPFADPTSGDIWWWVQKRK